MAAVAAVNCMASIPEPATISDAQEAEVAELRPRLAGDRPGTPTNGFVTTGRFEVLPEVPDQVRDSLSTYVTSYVTSHPVWREACKNLQRAQGNMILTTKKVNL